MKMKEFGPPGGRASLAPPLDPPMHSQRIKPRWKWTKIKKPAKEMEEKSSNIQENFALVFAFTWCDWAFTVVDPGFANTEGECQPIITARKRSLRRFGFTPVCQSFCSQAGQVCLSACDDSRPPWEQTPPRNRHHPQEQTPLPRSRQPPCTVHAGRYSQEAGSTHPTGMHTCLVICLPKIAWKWKNLDRERGHTPLASLFRSASDLGAIFGGHPCNLFYKMGGGIRRCPCRLDRNRERDYFFRFHYRKLDLFIWP